MKQRNNFAVLFFLISGFLTHTNGQLRIFDAQYIKINRSPHSVAILQPLYQGNVLRCTGSLVNMNTVLTSAYVGAFYKDAIVGAGVTNLSDIERGIGQTRKVQKIYYYDNDPETKYLSLTVLKLKSPFQKNNSIKSISLCETPLEPHSMIEIRGWGAVDAVRRHSNHLKTKTVKVKDAQECRNMFANREPRVYLPDTVICAGDRGDLGVGDHGAGGVLGDKLCAVAQLSCKSSNEPDLYTDVGIKSVRDFIISKM